jgi:glutamine transport system substrate-binding protein
MNKIRAKFSLLLTVCCVFMLAACGSNQVSGSPDGKTKTLTVGTNAAFAPFEYMDKGKVTGFDVDLIHAVAKEAGYQVNVQNEGWDSMLANLENKQSDLAISGITINDDRKKTYDFSRPYFEAANVIVVKKGSNVHNALDLKGKKVGVQNGTTGQDAAEKILGKNSQNVKKYEDVTVAFMALKNKEVDAVVIDNVVANEYVKNHPKENLKVIPDRKNFQSEFYGIAFPKGSDLTSKFDQALEKVMENGTYEKLYKKWFGKEPDMEVLKKAKQ